MSRRNTELLLLLVDLVAVLGYRVLRIVDTCLRNARLEAVLRVFGQVGQLDAGFAFEPVELESEWLAGQAAPDGDIALVGTQVVRAGDTRVGPDASCQHKDEEQTRQVIDAQTIRDNTNQGSTSESDSEKTAEQSAEAEASDKN